MSVCSVIVTYNRKHELLRCLRALLKSSQTVNTIIVVDNCSTDGSYDFLVKQGVLPNAAVVWLGLSENLGGAGGFYEGMKFALETGNEYVWLMDDDGFPDGNCLSELLKHISRNVIVGPAVVNSFDSSDSMLSFDLSLKKFASRIRYYSDFKRLFPDECVDVIFPFNGTLIPVEIIRKIGLPEKKYFIWGDEIEYIFRLKKAGFTVKTVTDALFYHPKKQDSSISMFFGLLRYCEPGSNLKRYCYVRNNLKNYLEYKSKAIAVLFLCKVFWFNLFTQYDKNRLKIAFKAVTDCLKGDFTRHKDYIDS